MISVSKTDFMLMCEEREGGGAQSDAVRVRKLGKLMVVQSVMGGRILVQLVYYAWKFRRGLKTNVVPNNVG